MSENKLFVGTIDTRLVFDDPFNPPGTKSGKVKDEDIDEDFGSNSEAECDGNEPITARRKYPEMDPPIIPEKEFAKLKIRAKKDNGNIPPTEKRY